MSRGLTPGVTAVSVDGARYYWGVPSHPYGNKNRNIKLGVWWSLLVGRLPGIHQAVGLKSRSCVSPSLVGQEVQDHQDHPMCKSRSKPDWAAVRPLEMAQPIEGTRCQALQPVFNPTPNMVEGEIQPNPTMGPGTHLPIYKHEW